MVRPRGVFEECEVLKMRWLLLLFLLSPSIARAACGTPADELPAPYGGLVRGESALNSGRFAEALTELEAAVELPDGPAARRRLVLLGKARILSGDLDGGRAVLETVLVGDRGAGGVRASACDGDPAEARWWIAQAAVRAGQYDEALPGWRGIWSRNPTSTWSPEAEKLLKKHDPAWLGAEPGARVKLADERAAAFAKRNLHKEALAVLEALVPDDGTEAYRRRMAHALFKAREYRRAVAGFATLESPEPQDRFDRALAASRYGDYALAGTLYTALVADFHGRTKTASIRRIVDDASFKIGYLDYDAGRLDAGLDKFAEHLTRLPGSRHADEAHWFTGWSLFKRGRYEDADVAFARLVKEHERSSLAAGGRYWRARIAGLNGDAGEAMKGLEAVIAIHPDSSYAWWASRALGRSWEAPEDPEPPLGDGTDNPGLKRGIALLQAGIDDWAATELNALAKRARKKGRDQSLYLATQLVEAGEWAAARKLANPYCGPAHKRKDLAALRLCWPMPEGELAAAIDEHLPRLLPFAIMRAESAYQPTISSAAGARGLMQMMPKLGVALYAKLHPDAGPLDPERLFDAATNVELGVAELSGLSQTLADTGVDPRLPLVIAGYNGGETAVRRWLGEQTAPVEADRWSEDIGYSETRRYVRRVLGTLQVYRYVYGD
jgi:soluble lytic murein transglycosylase